MDSCESGTHIKIRQAIEEITANDENSVVLDLLL